MRRERRQEEHEGQNNNFNVVDMLLAAHKTVIISSFLNICPILQVEVGHMGKILSIATFFM